MINKRDYLIYNVIASKLAGTELKIAKKYKEGSKEHEQAMAKAKGLTKIAIEMGKLYRMNQTEKPWYELSGGTA